LNISVICPVFNTLPHLLLDAASSVLDERGVTELILVDDGSSNAGILAACAVLRDSDARVVLARLPLAAAPDHSARNQSARQHGLRLAKGEWVGFLDADGIWRPDRAAKLAELLEWQPDAVWVAGLHGVLAADGQCHPAPALAPRLRQDATTVTRLRGPALTRALIADSCLHLGAVLVRRELAQLAGGFADGLADHETSLFLTKLSVLATLHALPDVVYGSRPALPAARPASPDARQARGAVRMHRLAAADPLLRGFRGDVRRAGYGARKEFARGDLQAGRPGAALSHALAAYCTDPRKIRDLAGFLQLWSRGRPAALVADERYSYAERLQTRTG
jgi:hypothetical protein